MKEKIITSSGFECEIDEDALDDYELLDALTKVDKGQNDRITDAVDLLLGDEIKQRLIDHVRKENGRASVEAVVKEFGEILTGLESAKK